MKKFIFTIAAFVLGISQMSAQKLVFGDVDLPLGGQATLTVKYETGGESLTTASFTLTLPDGVSSEKKSDGGARFVLNDDMVESFAAYTTAADGYSVAATSLGVQFPGTSGVLGTVTLIAAADAANLKIGESYPVTVSGLSLVKRTSTGLVSIPFDDITFNVNIVEDRVIFNETDTKLPSYTAGKGNVRMTRKMTAGKWNTICLPFTLQTAQLKEAFGNDVAFAQFSGWKAEYDFEGGEAPYKPQSIEIQFTKKSTTPNVPGGKPFLVKPSKDVETFEFDNVTLVDKITDSSYGDANDYSLSGVFKGTFVKTTVPENGLFISGEQFYYSKSSNSKGLTAIKGFRGWFELGAVLDEGTDFGAKISFTIDDEATEIEGFTSTPRIVEGVYDLSGRKIQLENGDLNKLQKGVYIIDGKKVTIK